MTDIEELYHLLGYLEGLSMKVIVLPYEMEKVKSIIQSNSYFEGTIGHVPSTGSDYRDVERNYVDCNDRRNWSKEYFAEVGWDIDDLDPSHDPSQNPWIDVFGPGDEAEMAYLNHD